MGKGWTGLSVFIDLMIYCMILLLIVKRFKFLKYEMHFF